MALTPIEHIDAGGSFGTRQTLTNGVTSNPVTKDGIFVIVGQTDAAFYMTGSVNGEVIMRGANPTNVASQQAQIMSCAVKTGDTLLFSPKTGSSSAYAYFLPYA